MSNTKRIAHNTIVQVVSRFLTAAISLVTIGYLTRYLGVEGYGQYNLIWAYLGLFGVVVDFGFFLLQVKEVVNNPGNEDRVLGNVFGLKLILAVIAFAAAVIIGGFVYDDPVIQSGIMVGIISQAAISFLHLPNSLFQARLQMHIVAIANILARLLYGGAVIWAVTADQGLLNIIWVISGVNLVTFIGMMLVAARTVRILPRIDLTYWKKFLIEALPIGAVTVLAMIYFRIDTVMLGYLADDYAVGIYSAPYKILDVILTVPVIFMSSVFPILTQALTQGMDNAQRIFSKAFHYSVIAAVPIVIGTYMLATPIILILAGGDFAGSAPVLQILIWVTALSFIGSVLNYTVIAAGRQHILVWPYLVATAFNIVLNLILIPRYSYFGAAFATILTELIVVLWSGWLVYRHLDLRVVGWEWSKGFVAGGVMGLGLWITSDLGFVWQAIIAVIVYSTVLVAIGGVPRSVLYQLVKK